MSFFASEESPPPFPFPGCAGKPVEERAALGYILAAYRFFARMASVGSLPGFVTTALERAAAKKSSGAVKAAAKAAAKAGAAPAVAPAAKGKAKAKTVGGGVAAPSAKVPAMIDRESELPNGSLPGFPDVLLCVFSGLV